MSKNFFMIPNRVFDLGLGCKAIAVYCCIRRHAGNSADCFPSRALIAKGCNLSISAVDRALKELAGGKHTFKRKSVCRKALRDLCEAESRISGETFVTSGKAKPLTTSKNLTTVNDLFCLWAPTKINARENTRQKLYEYFRHYVENTLGLKDVRTVKTSDVKLLYNATLTEKNLSKFTIKKVHNILKETHCTHFLKPVPLVASLNRLLFQVFHQIRQLTLRLLLLFQRLLPIPTEHQRHRQLRFHQQSTNH